MFRCIALWAGFLCATVCGGCRKPPPPYSPPPPPEVTVAAPVSRMVPMTLELTGTLRAVEAVEVRARVKGFIEKKFVKGGERVKAGDPLYTIDQRPFESLVRQMSAEVESRKATKRLAEVTLRRVQEAREGNAVSQLEADKALADVDRETAQVELAEAMLASAKLDLEYTSVVAPITGRVGIATIDPGQLVGASESTLLATIANDSRVYATYTIDENQLLQIRREANNRRPGEDGREGLEVRLGQANETGYPHVGRFVRGDIGLAPGTGTLTVESEFDNADGALIPGAYVRLQAVLSQAEALTLPDTAVLSDQRGRYVLTVGADGKAVQTQVEVGGVVDRQRVIRSGLDPSATVIVNGLQRVRPGQPVTAVAAPGGDDKNKK